MLAEIVRSQPHAANAKGYKSKFVYDSFEDYVEPTDEAINSIFLPVHFGQTEPIPDELQELGGLGIPDLKPEASQQHVSSKLITAACNS